MKRTYEVLIGDHFAHNRQMAFLSGPRQVGKTTLTEMLLPRAHYLNYDRPSDATAIAAGPDRVAQLIGLEDPTRGNGGIIFDELHKFSKWKRFLKGFFDVHGKGLNIAVTGSARLNVYKRGGDSLMGRYFAYRIHPLSVGELAGGALRLESPFRKSAQIDKETLPALLRFGGYPEPFLSANMRFYNRWKNARKDLVFHEDLRDLSRVQDIRGVATLAELLSSRVSGGINYASLAGDLKVSPDTAKEWLGLLEAVYEVFTIRPWFKNVSSAIRKQPKAYFWDWSAVPDAGMRHENFIASHLLKSVHWWCDSGLGNYDLHYLRDKQQREVDFLISKDGTPHILIECKSSMGESLSSALEYFQKKLNVPYALQVGIDGEQSGIDPFGYPNRAIKISAADLLSILI